jgi:extracellular elastinolytic metalloproteinase
VSRAWGLQRTFRPRLGIGTALACTLALLVLAGTAGAVGPAKKQEGRSFFDVRFEPAALAQEASATASMRAAQAALLDSLGFHGVVDIDRLTGTPRVVARLDGFLTGPSEGGAKEVALGYVRVHADVFGLDVSDFAALRLTRAYTDIGGTTHLRWVQTYRGIPALDNGLSASVTKDGRLVNVLGSPRRRLRLADVAPGLSAAAALGYSLHDAGAKLAPPRVLRRAGTPTRDTRFAGGHRAGLVLFTGPRGVRLAWRVLAHAKPTQVFDYVVDANTGEVLRRANLVDFAQARVFDYYPGAANGGAAALQVIDPWLAPGTTTLTGPNAHAYVDANSDNVAEEVGPSSTPPATWDYLRTAFSYGAGGCPAGPYHCAWNHMVAGSWVTNKNQSATQLFYYVNTFHDHLAASPIGFNPAAGNFEVADPLLAEADDGAAGPGNLPDESHRNNANMFTPPDGFSPRMQMYLFSPPFFPAVNGADDASVVYHEYTHGLSSRLVTDASGFQALHSAQAGAMGEGWSDWYAMDYLVGSGLAPDTAADGDVTLDRYVGNNLRLLRTEGLDCPPGSLNSSCPGRGLAGSGGYTYGDFGRIFGSPEVHADGEIWGQTLWDLRTAIGFSDARGLVTRAMELSPPEPSFLDMRNAILQADTVAGGTFRNQIWGAFATRGLGYFASSVDSGDVAPVEDFSLPPAPGGPTGSLGGIVTEFDSGSPIAGARVGVAGHDSGFQGGLGADTGAAGDYVLSGIAAGSYPRVLATKPGYDRHVLNSVPVAPGARTTRNFMLRRDYASLAGGSAVVAHTGPNYSAFGCGPSAAFDQSLSTGWSTDLAGGSKSVTVRLPIPINIIDFAIDPGAVCGDDDSASLGQFSIATAPDGVNFTASAAGAFTAASNHHLNRVRPTGGTARVRFVRLTMHSSQSSDGAGGQFVDVSELEVYGLPLPPNTRLVSHPPKLTRKRTATFGFSSSLAGSTFRCRVDRSPFVACTTPTTVRSLTHGLHTFYVRAGKNGAFDATAAKWTWRVDLRAPNTTILTAPPVRFASRTARFTFRSSETGSTFQCKLDARAFRACLARKTYRGLARGRHVLLVRAKDRAGNLDPTPVRHVWRVGS